VELRIFTEPQMGATYDQILAVAKETEALGFDAFFRSDHLLGFDPEPAPPGSTDAWITLGGLARETSRIRLGTLVTPVTFRLPGPLAISVAQVDAMSGGRVELGLGTGWFDREHAAFGIPFPPTGERFDMLEEQLAIVTGLWGVAEGETFSFAGAHYTVEDSPGLPKPVQRPGPPIVIGGFGAKRTPRLAAAYAAEFNTPFARIDDFTAACARVVGACEEIQRDPATLVLSAALTVCCGADEAEVERRAAAIGQPAEQLRAGGAAGTPQEVLDRIGLYRDAGATRMYLQVLDLDDLDHLRLLGSEVLPHV
jgi:F420-dependent oxidoreductase-like protein